MEMSSRERITEIENVLEGSGSKDQETIIPRFQTPDECVFCTSKNYDSIFYSVYRQAYNYKTDQENKEHQNKESCIHHKDEWLKHSLRSAGFIWSAFTDYGKRNMTSQDVIDVMKDKEKWESILNKEYDLIKNF